MWYSIWFLMIYKISLIYKPWLWLRKIKTVESLMAMGTIFIFQKWKVQVWVTEFLRFIARNNSRHTNLCTRTTTTTYDDTTLYVDGVLCNIIIWAWLKNVKNVIYLHTLITIEITWSKQGHIVLKLLMLTLLPTSLARIKILVVEQLQLFNAQ